MPCKRGDVVTVLFPNSDLTSSKYRPALVIQASNLESGIPQTIIAMITTNMSRLGHPSRVFVKRGSDEGESAGLLDDSIVMTDNIATVRNAAIGRKLGNLNDMTQVDNALRHTFGI